MTRRRHDAELLALTTYDPAAFGEARRKIRAQLDSGKPIHRHASDR